MKKYNIAENEYYLVIARLIPDNNIDLIIEGYKRSNSTKKLVIVGPLDKSSYVRKLLAQTSEKVLFVGGIYEPRLQRTFRHNCFAYIHGHEMGGVNPSLVEVLSSKNVVLAIDVSFNRVTAKHAAIYFKKDPDDLKEKIEALEECSEKSNLKEEAYLIYKKKYAVELMVGEFIGFVSRISKLHNLPYEYLDEE